MNNDANIKRIPDDFSIDELDSLYPLLCGRPILKNAVWKKIDNYWNVAIASLIKSQYLDASYLYSKRFGLKVKNKKDEKIFRTRYKRGILKTKYDDENNLLYLESGDLDSIDRFLQYVKVSQLPTQVEDYILNSNYPVTIADVKREFYREKKAALECIENLVRKKRITVMGKKDENIFLLHIDDKKNPFRIIPKNEQSREALNKDFIRTGFYDAMVSKHEIYLKAKNGKERKRSKQYWKKIKSKIK